MISERLRDARLDEWSDTAEKLREAADVIDALVAALEKAMLWTDEENDVGEWRQGPKPP